MTEEKIKKNKQRSAAYPVITLEASVGRLTTLYQNLGKGPYSREDAAKGMGFGGINGASARVVAALVQYGFLDRNGNTYSLSLLSNGIISPISELEKSNALKTSVASPKLFSSLIEKFKGQSLPGLLENLLIREGISQNCVKDVALNFKESLQYAGMLVNGVVSVQNIENDTSLDVIEDEKTAINSQSLIIDNKNESEINKSHLNKVTISLGPDITVVFSEKIIKNIALGILGSEFTKTMESLKKFAGDENENNSDSTTNSSME